MTLEERVEIIKEYLEFVKESATDRLIHMTLIGASYGFHCGRQHVSSVILMMLTDDKFLEIIRKANKERKARENHERT